MSDFIEFLSQLDLSFFLMVVFSGGIGLALNDLRRAYACKRWPTTEGVIVSSESDYKTFYPYGEGLTSKIAYQAKP